ncbi:hypothetical protein ONZ45_g14726 [Pleurotus djamor]|nr:hypothetical protein ONZ45_g14726 [Pleurotus djamor]
MEEDSIRLTEIRVYYGNPLKSFPETLDVQLDGLPRQPSLKASTESSGTWIWVGGIEVASKSNLQIQIPEKSLLRTKRRSVTVPVGEILSLRQTGEPSGSWQKAFPKFTVTFKYTAAVLPNVEQVTTTHSPASSPSSSNSELPSTVGEITRICPRFRVLVIGKSGVGKSSLINKAFGVSAASVSKGKPGVHDINFEINSEENAHFVVHDSQGFEHGEEGNFETVTKFIQERKLKPDLKDRLHAIWLCIEIPCSGGRVFEIGDEKIIQLQLGHVPFVIVFTKFDKLVTQKLMNLKRNPSRTNGRSNKQVLELARMDAEKAFEDICLGPLRSVIHGSLPPFIKVSNSDGYNSTLTQLVDLTYTNVEKYLTSEVSLISAIAQRISSDSKIYASIAVGKRKYWDALGHSTNFPGRSLKTCLDVIHRDIIGVWNFPDPKRHLLSPEFKALMTHVANELADSAAPDPNKTVVGGLSLLGAAAGIVGGLSGPAAPIVVPILACFIFAKWAYDVYQQSGEVLRHLMSYIIDLTIILQIIFVLSRGETRPINRRMIKFAVKTYKESYHSNIHMEIYNYTTNDSFSKLKRQGVVSKIVELIDKWKLDESDGFKLVESIGSDVVEGLRSNVDEQWDTPSAT